MPQRKLAKQSIWDVAALREHMTEYQVKPVHLRNVWKFGCAAESLEDVCCQLATGKSPPPGRWLRALQGDFMLCTSTVIDAQPSKTSSGCKLVIQLQDGLVVEAVVMKADAAQDSDRSSERVTLCVSSQAGCRMGCTFCETGTLGHLGNLTAGEIVEQLYHAERWLAAGSMGDVKVRNIVFMGMGEPLDNYAAVVGAVEAMMCNVSFEILGRHITISTVGVVPGVRQLAVEPLLRHVNLAVSLHAATQPTRLRIVPSAKGFQLDKLVAAMREYCEQTNRGIMIEYIVLAGVNDSDTEAEHLAKLLTGLDCWVNLIPYNPTSIGDSNGFKTPSDEVLRQFWQTIRRHNCKNHLGEPISVRTRFSTQGGHGIDSACGQLAAAKVLKGPSAAVSEQRGHTCDVEELHAPQLAWKTSRHIQPAGVKPLGEEVVQDAGAHRRGMIACIGAGIAMLAVAYCFQRAKR